MPVLLPFQAWAGSRQKLRSKVYKGSVMTKKGSKLQEHQKKLNKKGHHSDGHYNSTDSGWYCKQFGDPTFPKSLAPVVNVWNKLVLRRIQLLLRLSFGTWILLALAKELASEALAAFKDLFWRFRCGAMTNFPLHSFEEATSIFVS